MLVLIGAALAIGVSVVTLLYTMGRRSGLFDLGTVSAQWLAEYREYQREGQIAMTRPVPEASVPVACPTTFRVRSKGPTSRARDWRPGVA